MKCNDVQSELWSGRKSVQLDEHIAGCVNCQREMADIQQIVGSLRAIEVPTPTRSLIPQREVIEQAVKHNRRKPWKRLSTIAAAATVVLGIGTGLAINHLQSGPLQNADQPQTVDTEKGTVVTQDPITIQTKDEPELMQAAKQYLEQIASVEGVRHIDIQRFDKDPNSTDTSVRGLISLNVALHANSTSKIFIQGMNKPRMQFKKTPDGQWSVVSLDPTQNVEDPNLKIENRIETYLRSKYGVPDVKVISFTPDPSVEEKVITGKVTLDVNRTPESPKDAALAFKSGINERYVLLTKVQGVWTLDLIGLEPYKVTDAPEGTRDFNKVAQIMYGTFTEVHISQQDESGKDVPHLDYVKLKVEKNATTSNNTDAGKELTIGFNFNLAPSYTPKAGERVAVFVAKADPRVNAGMETWYGQRDYYYYEKNGQFYDLVGQQTDPMHAYAEIQMSR